MKPKIEPWPTPLFPGVTAEQAQRMWPRDMWFRPDKITLARHARGLTIAEAASMAGISRHRLSRLERNLTHPTDDDKQRICEAWKFPPSFFAQPDPIIDFRHQFTSRAR